MTGIQKTAKSLGACAIAAALLAPVAATAQLSLPSNHTPRYHLVQLSVEAANISVAEFSQRTAAIDTCGDAANLARELDADFRRNRFISATRLPDELKDELRDLSAGQATRVHSDDGETMRVILLCSPGLVQSATQ